MTEPRDFAALRKILTDHGAVLLRLAAESISHGLSWGKPVVIEKAEFADELAVDGACFVTLKHGGELRGCVGSPRAHRPLIDDVAANAFAAAFADTRFPPLRPAERQDLSLSVTVLSPPEALVFANEAALCSQLRPHVDGLIIECDGRSAVFLPQVWEVLPAPGLFLEQLKMKAGLHACGRPFELTAWRFVAECVSSEQLDSSESLWR
ncbi:MAG TPA: AmmeMemoRadiSam system protein A [Rhodospirillales bacterium]|nr:AmmeMemoRadiSam system protein A [Rhodospirillales bacterium]